MILINVTQIGGGPDGTNRVFQYHVTEDEFSQRMNDIHRAFNMDHTRVEWCDCGKGDYCPQFGKLFGRQAQPGWSRRNDPIGGRP